MHEFEAGLGRWVVRYRWLIIVATLLAVIGAAAGGRFLTFTTNYRAFFGPENPQLLAFDRFESTYSKNDNVMFVIAPNDGNVFTPEVLALVEEITQRAWQTPYSTRVDSISNFQYTEADGDELLVRNLIEDAGQYSSADVARVKAIALNEPLLTRNLVSPQGHVTGINITIQLPGKNEAVEVPSVARFARDLADEARTKHPDVSVYLTGMVMMNNAFSESSFIDLKTLFPISFVLMVLVIGLLLRGFSGTFVTSLVIVFSIVTAMGLGGYAGITLTPPSVMSPIIILTLAIASSVHILVTFLHELRRGSDKKTAMIESLRVNLQPIFLASLTTVFGFLSMNFSDAPPFRHLGNLVALGVAASFFYSVFFLPALMMVLPVRQRIQEETTTGMDRLAEFVIARRTMLLWSTGAATLVLVGFIAKNQLNDVFVHYFDETVEFRRHSDFVDANLGGLYRIDYSLAAGEPGGISDPAYLRDVVAFADWWRAQPEVSYVNTFTDIMLRLNKNMHGDDPAWYTLPETRELAAQYLLLYELSLPYGLDLNNQVDVDKSATRMTISVRTLSSNEVLGLERRARDWLSANTPRLADSAGTGPTIMFAHIGQRNIISMLSGTTIALILISLVLVVALRSVKIGLISMLPNLIPAAMAFGLWGIFVGEVGLALSVVTGMTLGIVVDDTIHLLSKYLRARREEGLSPPDSVRYAFRSVGKAVWVTSVVLIVGFMVLALSSFKLNSDMGLLTSVVIALALAADLLFLPPLLMKIEEKNNEETVATTIRAEPAGS